MPFAPKAPCISARGNAPDREPLIDDEVRPNLHGYMAVVLRNIKCAAVLINSMEDHAHIFFQLARTVPICDAAEEVKKSSSKWIKTQGERFAPFAWQSGYGVFAVSQSNVSKVREYIADQQIHHRRDTFQDEYRKFLANHEVEFDERHVGD